MVNSLDRVLLIFVASVVTNSALANDWCASRNPWATGAGGTFGSAVAMSDSWVAIGDPSWTYPGQPGGAVLVYSRTIDRIDLNAVLLSPDPGVDGNLGWKVAVGGNSLFASKGPGSSPSPIRRVQVYEPNNGVWEYRAELIPNNPGYQYCDFGSAMSIKNDIAIVGEPGRNMAFRDRAGAAYIFRQTANGWNQIQRLVADDADEGDELGTAVAVAGADIITGAPYADVYGVANDAGAVYVYRENGANDWQQAQKLSAPDAGPGDGFGWSVAASESRIVVGAPFAIFNGIPSGAAYVYDRIGTQWEFQARLLPTMPLDWGLFGTSVSVSGSDLLVGATEILGNSNPINTGRVYAFSADSGSWQATQVIVPPGAETNSQIGTAICSDATLALVCRHNDDFYQPGHPIFVTVLARDGADVNANGISDVCECFGDLTGDRSVSLNDLAIQLANFGIASGATPEQGDVDGDGDVDLSDLSQLLAAFGNECA